MLLSFLSVTIPPLDTKLLYSSKAHRHTTKSIKETSNRLTRSLNPLLTALLRPPLAHCLTRPAPNSTLNLMGSHLHSTSTETFIVLLIQGSPLIRALKRQIEDERLKRFGRLARRNAYSLAVSFGGWYDVNGSRIRRWAASVTIVTLLIRR